MNLPIRLRNTAYGFAEAIAGAVAGEGSGSGGNNLFIGGKQILSYESNTGTTSIHSPYIDFKNSVLQSKGELIIGENKESGIYLSPQSLLIKGNEVFCKGNANLESVDWQMKDGAVAGNLEVRGTALFSGLLKSCGGVELGIEGKVFIYIDNEQVNLNSFLSFASGYGIKIENIPVLVRINEKDIQLGAAGGDLHIGNSGTNKIRLQANVSDSDGQDLYISVRLPAVFSVTAQ